MPSDYVTTSIPAGAYEITGERAPIFEADSALATVTVPICYRGTRDSLLTAFPFGTLITGLQGGGNMFCAGFAGEPTQVPYTTGDPHWDAEVLLVGIHNQISGQSGPYLSGDHALILTSDWTTRETPFPIVVQQEDGTTVYVSPGPPIVPGGVGTSGPHKGRRIDHVITRNLTGIIISATEPDPLHPRITLAVNAFPDPSSQLIKDYTTLLLDPVWVTFHGIGNQLQSAPNTYGFAGTSGGAWLCRNLKITKRISPPGGGPSTRTIYFIAGTWSWEQLRQPS